MKSVALIFLVCVVVSAAAVPRSTLLHDLAKLKQDLRDAGKSGAIVDDMQAALATSSKTGSEDDNANAIAEIVKQAINKHCVMDVALLFDRSGSIAKPEIFNFVTKLLRVLTMSIGKIHNTLKSTGAKPGRIGLWGYSQDLSPRYTKPPSTFYDCIKNNVRTDQSCHSKTHTLSALLGLHKEHKPKTTLLVTDGIASENQDPAKYIKRLRTDGYGVIVVYVGTSAKVADHIEAYTNVKDGVSSGFFKAIVSPENPGDPVQTARDVVDRLCVESKPMIAHFQTGKSTLTGGKCNSWPKQSEEIDSIKDSLKRASCHLDTSKVYVIGRFSGDASDSNKNFGIARAKTVRSVIVNSSAKIPKDKFVIGWGMAGSTKEGDCEAQRVDVFCGEATAVDIPPELAWEQVDG